MPRWQSTLSFSFSDLVCLFLCACERLFVKRKGRQKLAALCWLLFLGYTLYGLSSTTDHFNDLFLHDVWRAWLKHHSNWSTAERGCQDQCLLLVIHPKLILCVLWGVLSFLLEASNFVSFLLHDDHLQHAWFLPRKANTYDVKMMYVPFVCQPLCFW